jgi:hypothetical protein
MWPSHAQRWAAPEQATRGMYIYIVVLQTCMLCCCARIWTVDYLAECCWADYVNLLLHAVTCALVLSPDQALFCACCCVFCCCLQNNLIVFDRDGQKRAPLYHYLPRLG